MSFLANKPEYTYLDFRQRIYDELAKLNKGKPPYEYKYLFCRLQAQIYDRK